MFFFNIDVYLSFSFYLCFLRFLSDVGRKLKKRLAHRLGESEKGGGRCFSDGSIDLEKRREKALVAGRRIDSASGSLDSHDSTTNGGSKLNSVAIYDDFFGIRIR